jgi:hypothetical protein
MPDAPSVNVLPELMTIGKAGFKILIPPQLVLPPNALVAKAGLAAVMVESQIPMSADPGATPPTHDAPEMRLPPVSALVMEAAHAPGMLEASNKMQTDKERIYVLFFMSLGFWSCRKVVHIRSRHQSECRPAAASRPNKRTALS